MTVRKEENGTWSVRCWYRNWKGERKQKTKRGFLKQKDAKIWERQFLSSEQHQTIYMAALITAYKQQLDTLQSLGKLKASTIQNKKQYIERYIEGYFENAPAINITPQVVNTWLAQITKKHGYGSRMSSGTTRMARSILSQIFDYGIKNYGLIANPVKQSDLPAAYSNDERAAVWTVDEFTIFYNSLKKEINKTMFLTLYWSGLRIGELLALTADDIKENLIIVNKTWTEPTGSAGYATTPKTGSSVRSVVVPGFVYEQLRHYISTIDNLIPTDRIFPVYASTPSHLLRHRCAMLGLPKISLHTLRHSYASNLLAQTNDYVSTSAQLGHASPHTTFKTYAHSIRDGLEKSVEKLAELKK